jgi:hypothetical protein
MRERGKSACARPAGKMMMGGEQVEAKFERQEDSEKTARQEARRKRARRRSSSG